MSTMIFTTAEVTFLDKVLQKQAHHTTEIDYNQERRRFEVKVTIINSQNAPEVHKFDNFCEWAVWVLSWLDYHMLTHEELKIINDITNILLLMRAERAKTKAHATGCNE